LSVHQFAGENVSDLAEAFQIAAKELTIAGQYDDTYAFKMLKAFLVAGGGGQTAEIFALSSISCDSLQMLPY
jgi:hypothetical protein